MLTGPAVLEAVARGQESLDLRHGVAVPDNKEEKVTNDDTRAGAGVNRTRPRCLPTEIPSRSLGAGRNWQAAAVTRDKIRGSAADEVGDGDGGGGGGGAHDKSRSKSPSANLVDQE